VDFFDDDVSGTPPEPPARHRTRSRKSLQVQRVAVVLVVLFLVVFLMAWWIISCQHNRKVASYRTYFQAVAAAVNDSNKLGRTLNSIVSDPTQFTRTELADQLLRMSSRQTEIALRVQRLASPSTLDSENTVFVTGMQVRQRGFALLRKALLAAMAKSKAVTTASIAALAGYFVGPDVYYQTLFYSQAQQTMSANGVTGVAVPVSSYFQKSRIFDPARLSIMLAKLKGSAKLSGVHGVALVKVVDKQSGTTLLPGKRVTFAAPSTFVFTVSVANQGDAVETNVPVKVTYVPPGGGQPVEKTATISSIEPRATQSVDVSVTEVPTTAISQVSTLKVTVGPVPGELHLSNNHATYLFMLKIG
jgi:hypothetical protein